MERISALVEKTPALAAWAIASQSDDQQILEALRMSVTAMLARGGKAKLQRMVEIAHEKEWDIESVLGEKLTGRIRR